MLGGKRKRGKGTKVTRIDCVFGQVILGPGQLISTVDDYVSLVMPWFLTGRSTLAHARLALLQLPHHDSVSLGKKRELMAMSDDDLRSMLKGVWLQPNHPINQTSVIEFDVGTLQKKARKENQYKKRRAVDAAFKKLETISAEAQVKTTLLVKSATAQEKITQVETRMPQRSQYTPSSDGSVHVKQPHRQKNKFMQVAGRKIPKSRGVKSLLQEHRASTLAMYNSSDVPLFYMLCFTDQSKREVHLRLPSSYTPSLCFGIMIDPRRSFELAVRKMVERQEVARGSSTGQYELMVVGDGTDAPSKRNLVGYGFKIIEKRQEVLLNASPFFPVVLYSGKESLHRKFSPEIVRAVSIFLNTALRLEPQGSVLTAQKTVFVSGDSKWVWSHTGVKNGGECVCYLCGMSRSDFGAELGSTLFKDLTIFDLACRYLRSLYELYLLQMHHTLREGKGYSMTQLRMLRTAFTNEHGSIRFPALLNGNGTAHMELVTFLGNDLLGMGADISDWDINDRARVFKLYSRLILLSDQLHDETLTQNLISTQGFSLKNCIVTVPIEHDLKALLRFYCMDFLLLGLKSGKARSDLEKRIWESAGSKSWSDYFYSYSALKIFLVDRAKWDVLPRQMLMLVRMLEIVADQVVSSNVSDFYCLTFAAAVFLHRDLCFALKEEVKLYKQSQKRKQEENISKNFFNKGSQWYHSFMHAVMQLFRTRIPLNGLSEGVIDQWLGVVKDHYRGRGNHTGDDVPRIFMQILDLQDTELQAGLVVNRTKQKRYVDRPPRNRPMLFAPCFCRHEKMRTVILNFTRQCDKYPCANLVKKHAVVPETIILTPDPTQEFQLPLSNYASNSNVLFFSFCEGGECDRCKGLAVQI